MSQYIREDIRDAIDDLIAKSYRAEALEDENRELRAEITRLGKLVFELGGERRVRYDRSRHHLDVRLLIDGEAIAQVRDRSGMLQYQAAKLWKDMERAVEERFGK